MSRCFSDAQVMEVLGAVALEKLLEHTTNSPATPHHAQGRGASRRPKWRAHPELDSLLGRELSDKELRKLNQKCNGKCRTYYVDWEASTLKRHDQGWDLDGAEQAIAELVEGDGDFVASADINRIAVAFDAPAAWLRDLVKAAGFTQPVKARLKFMGYERPDND